jgi:hypothetical protein
MLNNYVLNQNGHSTTILGQLVSRYDSILARAAYKHLEIRLIMIQRHTCKHLDMHI